MNFQQTQAAKDLRETKKSAQELAQKYAKEGFGVDLIVQKLDRCMVIQPEDAREAATEAVINLTVAGPAPTNHFGAEETAPAVLPKMTPEFVSAVLAPQVSVNNGAGKDVTPLIEAQPGKIVEVEGPETVVESKPEPPVVVEADGVTDDEIHERALDHIKNGKTDLEVKALLLDEFDGTEGDVDDFIKKAHGALSNLLSEQKREIEASHDAEDAVRQEHADAVDKAIESDFEAKRLWLENYCLKHNKMMPTDPKDIEKYTEKFREIAEREMEPEETFEGPARELFPECPIFPGALTDLARALFPSLPLEFKQWGLITHWGLLRSGIDTLDFESHFQPRFFTVFVSPPNTGKTGCINETRKAMECISKMVTDAIGEANNHVLTQHVVADVENIASADSGPFLVDEFFEAAKKAAKRYSDSICLDDAAKIILDPDELSGVFEKARTSVGRISTLFDEFLKLHSGNRTSNGTVGRGNRPVTNAHFAILSGTQNDKYPLLWVGLGAGGSGLASRFMTITTNKGQAPAVPLSTDYGAAEQAYKQLAWLLQLPGQKISLTPRAKDMLTNWWGSIDNTKASTTRILDTVKQLLIVLAVVNAPSGHTGTELTADVDLVEPCIEFGNYEIAVREKLMPGDSWNFIQAMELDIIDWAKKHTRKLHPKTKREFRQGTQPQRKPGGLGAFLQAWKNCVGADVLKLRQQPGKREGYSL